MRLAERLGPPQVPVCGPVGACCLIGVPLSKMGLIEFEAMVLDAETLICRNQKAVQERIRNGLIVRVSGFDLSTPSKKFLAITRLPQKICYAVNVEVGNFLVANASVRLSATVKLFRCWQPDTLKCSGQSFAP